MRLVMVDSIGLDELAAGQPQPFMPVELVVGADPADAGLQRLRIEAVEDPARVATESERDVPATHGEQLRNACSVRFLCRKEPRTRADVAADFGDWFLAAVERLCALAPAFDQKAVHEADRLRREATGVQRPRNRELAFPNRAQTSELQKNPLALVPAEKHPPFRWIAPGDVIERAEQLGEPRRVELGCSALRLRPARSVRIARVRAEIAAVARQERDAFEGNAAALQCVGDGTERASGKAWPFVDD